uniref:O-methyltransferase C-terminal domain-containing protein n=1 Tax=Aegilops tauschii subsp. strangulata TaxID=200361 RepID=A0A452ZJP0_AEGTS
GAHRQEHRRPRPAQRRARALGDHVLLHQVHGAQVRPRPPPRRRHPPPRRRRHPPPDSRQGHGAPVQDPLPAPPHAHAHRLGRLQRSPGGVAAEPLYALTPVSRLLVGSRNLVSIITMLLSPNFVTSFLGIGAWFEHSLPDPCLFTQAHGEALWTMADRDATFDALINDAMVSDSSFIMDIAIRECGEVFQGIGSLMDVGGGLGAAAQAISGAFPSLECTVMDLDHVVAKAPAGTDVNYVVGDMFESVPPADAVFLKWVLHDWGHEDCVKILKNCKKSIPPREKGGKVIIIDIVIGAGPSHVKHRELQSMFDLYMMIVDGIERDEQEWEKIFLEAGFSGYKVIHVLGFRSIIEVYP